MYPSFFSEFFVNVRAGVEVGSMVDEERAGLLQAGSMWRVIDAPEAM